MYGFRIRVMAAAMASLSPLLSSASESASVLSEVVSSVMLSGVVAARSGAAVANARVILQKADGVNVASGVSSRDGRFALSGVPAGSYSLLVTGPDGSESARAVSVGAAALDLGTITLQPVQTVSAVRVIMKRLDLARNGLSPDTGSSVYNFDRQDIEALPQGDSTPLNQVILRAPGVVQDSFGQLHMRGDHANLQYRVNGVVVPEAISGFGQALDTRFADQLKILTGALPAQYGYRTAGIIDIQTKGTVAESGGKVSILAGSHEHQELNGELSGQSGTFSWFVTGSTLQNSLGIENPTADRNALHDATRQKKGFGYLSYVIDSDSRASFFFGSAASRFQIPDRPGLAPTFILDGAPTLHSENLDARQNENNRFQILSYQRAVSGDVDFQVSVSHRYTDVHYQPDPVGDLEFNGIAAQIVRKNEANGFQGDLSWRLGTDHTVRTGLILSRERYGVDNAAQVFPATLDDPGTQTSNVPFTIVDNTSLGGHTYGAYLQDEWKATQALTVNYGLRFDTVDTVVKESQTSPRIGLVYDLGTKTRLHAGYARYFTPPPTELIDTTTVQRFLGTTNALPSDANTAVKSERSDYFDIGVAHQATPAITLGIDAYYRDVRHLQDEGQFGNALIFSAFNYEKGRIRGIELSGSYREGNFSGYLNAAYSLALGKSIETGQFNFGQDELDFIASHWVHLDHDQKWAGSVGASYHWPETTLTVDGLYGSGLRNGFANTQHLPGYLQANLGVAHTFDLPQIGKLEARLSINNVLDRIYELRDGTGIGVGAPQFAPRRAFYLGVSKPF